MTIDQRQIAWQNWRNEEYDRRVRTGRNTAKDGMAEQIEARELVTVEEAPAIGAAKRAARLPR